MITSRLKYTIDIYQIVESKNSFGSVTTSENFLYSIKADRKSFKYNDRFNVNGNFDESLTSFEVRYKPEINLKCSYVWRGVKYEIINIEEIGRKKALIITGRLIQ